MADVCLLAGTIVVAACIWRFLADPLKHIPGPFLARFTRLWEVNAAHKGHLEQVNIDLHKKYGPVVRLGPGRYSVDDPAAVRALYGLGQKFPKTDFYSPFGEPGNPNLFAERDINAHSESKKRVSSLYSVTSLLSYEPFVDRCTAQFTKILGEFADRETAFEATKWLQYYAFDVIGELTVGKAFGMLDHGSDHLGILADMDVGLSYSTYVGLLGGPLHAIFVRISKWMNAKNPFFAVLNFVDARIAAREAEGSQEGRDDFLGKMLRMRDAGKLPMKDLRVTMGANIGAGSDTTAVSLSSVVYQLMQNPDALQKLHQEVDAAAAEGRISDPVTYKEAQQLPYLQAVIKEALRIHPATGIIHAREITAGGVSISDTFFPEGSHVGVSPWALHYNTKVFGPDAAKFRPERWLSSKEDVYALEQNFFSFGFGSRTCIGKNVSLLEISKLVPQLYRQFDFVPDKGPGVADYTTHNNWFVKPSFDVRVKRRQA